MKKLGALLLLLLLPALLYGQGDSTKRHSQAVDTVRFYNNIRRISSERKWTSWLYGAIFVKPGKSKSKEQKKFPTKKVDKYATYENRIIRDIVIVTIDPFGANLSDTNVVVENKLIELGNKLHKKSRNSTIRNQLMFRKNQPLDPYTIRESERILRATKYVRDVRISVDPVTASKDSVDILVLLQDQWTISGSVKNGKVEVFDDNFLGFAHQFHNNISYGRSEKFVFRGSYTVPYIRNTFITGTAYYNTSSRNGEQGFSLGREFYSPVTKWAGGIDIIRRRSIDYIPINDTLDYEIPLKANIQDYWGGMSFKVGRGQGERSKSARVVFTGRIFNRNYLDNLPEQVDSFDIYQNSTLYLVSVGYSFRTYYKDKYVYRFGRTEDVPEGSLIALVGGTEKREIYQRNYLGVKATSGKHLQNIGYLSGAVEYGTFFRVNKNENGVFNLNLSYFSDLWSLKEWAMRQFVYFRYTAGYKRDKNERININGKVMYGLNSDEADGKNKIVLSFENVLYTPFQLLGFHFATMVFAGLGSVAETSSKLLKGRLFQVYGIGLLVRNENLVINTFQLSFGVYPNYPGGTEYKFNPISSYQLRFNDFFLSKPDLISYE